MNTELTSKNVFTYINSCHISVLANMMWHICNSTNSHIYLRYLPCVKRDRTHSHLQSLYSHLILKCFCVELILAQQFDFVLHMSGNSVLAYILTKKFAFAFSHQLPNLNLFPNSIVPLGTILDIILSGNPLCVRASWAVLTESVQTVSLLQNFIKINS